jgi:hypothetical protein
MNPLDFEGVEEALHRGVVETIAFATHRRRDAGSGENPPMSVGGVLGGFKRRRNIVFAHGLKPPVKRLCGRFPVEPLPWPGIEGRSYGADILSGVHAEIGAFREVLSQQSVCVLVGAALPRTSRITEMDLDPGIDPQASVLGHLSPHEPPLRKFKTAAEICSTPKMTANATAPAAAPSVKSHVGDGGNRAISPIDLARDGSTTSRISSSAAASWRACSS